jgi:tetratricopeptide (TPR) repeat protein
MSRFNHLEFGDDCEGQSHSPTGMKDEGFYLHEAESAFGQGQFAQALRAYSKILEFNPANPVAWTGQVRMLIELNEFPEAKLWADKALEKFPQDGDLLAAKAVALARNGDLKAALIFSDASFEGEGHTPYMWLARGDVLLARKEQRAAFCFEKALSQAPSDWVVLWLASRIYFFYRKCSIALKYAQQALVLNAGNAVVWLELGRCQQALGLVGPAENSFTQARQLDPSSEPARIALTELSQNGFLTRLSGRLRRLFSK